jgi:cytochrome b6
MSDGNTRKGLLHWLDERYSIRPLLDFVGHKDVPLGTHWMGWYFLGGATLFFFMIQIASGVLLLMYYQPGESTSYESIRYITTKVPFGWLVRSIHCWSAHLMTLSLFLHMYSTYFLKAYRKPRELTWVFGYALFAITLTFGFSGYLLPWNELAFFATAVGTDSVKSIPVIGQWMLEVMRGGTDVSINTLYRFFALHVVVLPLSAVALIGIHLLLIQRQGMALPVGETKTPRSMKFFPNFAVRDLLLWLGCLLLLALLASFLPYGPSIPGMEWELGKKADPLAPAYPGIKPEWYFLWVYQLLKEFPPHLLGMEGTQACMFIIVMLLGGGLLVPWLDRNAAKNRPSPAFTDLGVAVLIWWTFLTFKAWDLGGTLGADDPESRAAVARFSAWLVLGGACVVTALRAILGKYRWYFWSAAATLHVVLHGIVGLPYLIAGAISLGTGALSSVLLGRLSRYDDTKPVTHS